MVRNINGKTIQMFGNTLKYAKEGNVIIQHWASDNFDNFNCGDRKDIKITVDGNDFEFEVKKNKKSIVIYID